MAVVFASDWAQEIADVSGLVEYMNATIEIRNPQLLTRTGSISSGQVPSFTGDPVIWTGQARIASNRSQVNAGGTTSTNPTGIKAMRVQIPYDKDFPRVKRGFQIRVTNGGRNDSLMGYLFSVEADVNSSHMASITIECSVDVESEPVWA